MTPTNWFSFFFLIYFIAPGIYYEFRRLRHKPRNSETQFQEFGRVLVASTFISSISVLFLIFEYGIFQALTSGSFIFPNVSELNVTSNFGSSIGFLIAFAANAFLLVYIYDIFTIARHLPQSTSTPLWEVLFNNVQARPQINLNSISVKLARRILVRVSPYLRRINVGEYRDSDIITIPITKIDLLDGEVIFGMVDLFTNDYELADREIVLSPMKRDWIMFLPEPWQEFAKPVVHWKRKSVNIDVIKSIEVLHFVFPKE